MTTGDRPFAGRVAVMGGTGRQGLGLALRWAAAGLPVAIGSRDAQRARQAVDRLRQALERAGLPLKAEVAGAPNAEAAAWADVVVLTVPPQALDSSLPPLVHVLRDRVVVDVSAALVRTPDGHWRADLPAEGSTALRVRRLLGGHRRLAAAFHTVSSALLAEPRRSLAGDDTAVFADEPEAAETAAALARAVGCARGRRRSPRRGARRAGGGAAAGAGQPPPPPVGRVALHAPGAPVRGVRAFSGSRR
ncbi:NAD(P)-binding domain-containing protein [Geochorda subterranea]|uniref:NAD(P)-binding domain-containing protein n=1 Tax=Geochorda subterranea TaxID=3109564 RepID=A0ABZ1BM16_9FIRM|nr:NAD(P)-binding domain-containing protein [Limnochorda sp. LNt]WRP13558.1 NAD(P)-binding domain-containing protein [Limnochorda sp. LNt]